jgi:hypothetical protein
LCQRKAPTTQSAVRGVLDLEHRALVGGVRAVERLGDHAVEAGALEDGEPLRAGRVARDRREVDGRPGVGEQLLEPLPALRLRDVHQRLAVDREQVERDEGRGRVSASIRTRLSAGWMRCSSASKSSPTSPAMTISPSTTHRGGSCGAPPRRPREVARQRPLVAAAELDLVAVLEDDAAEAVPLRLVQVGARPGRRRPPWRASA